MGRNGSGKSTLLRLLAGLATPNEGEMLIAGMDMQKCRPGWLREVIGYLPQEVRLFSGTLAENLALGMSVPSEEQMRAAMEKTGLIQTLGRRSEEHTSELQSLMRISYAVFCLKKKKN